MHNYTTCLIYDVSDETALICLAQGYLVADMLREKMVPDCGKSQLYVAADRVKKDIAECDFGHDMGPRGRAYCTRQMMYVLRVASKKWLEKSEKHREALSNVGRATDEQE